MAIVVTFIATSSALAAGIVVGATVDTTSVDVVLSDRGQQHQQDYTNNCSNDS